MLLCLPLQLYLCLGLSQHLRFCLCLRLCLDPNLDLCLGLG